jgi:hypothetical protein
MTATAGAWIAILSLQIPPPTVVHALTVLRLIQNRTHRFQVRILWISASFKMTLVFGNMPVIIESIRNGIPAFQLRTWCMVSTLHGG